MGKRVGALTADAIVDLFEKDVRARRRLAELLVSEPETRLALINAVLREVATRGDLDKLRGEFRNDLEKLRGEFRSDLDKLRGEFRNDLEKLRGEFRSDLDRLWTEVKSVRSEVSRLEGRIDALESRVSRLEGQMGLFIRLFIAFNVPILVGIIGILLRLMAP